MDLVIAGQDGPEICDFTTRSRSSGRLEIAHEVRLTSHTWLFCHVAGKQDGGLEIRSLIMNKQPKVELHRHLAPG